MHESLYPQFSVLLVDDEPAWLRSLSLTLERSGGINNILQCQDSRQVMAMLAKNQVGLILLDLTMPHLSGEELLPLILEEHPDLTVIIVSGLNQIEKAVQCMKLGAYNYIIKTSEEGHLVKGVQHAIQYLELERENREMRHRLLSGELERPEVFSDIITQNSAMHSIFQYLEAVAGTGQPVLITGDSGVGKELFARAIHELSGRPGPLVSVNVAGLDDNIFADTLFGHLRGAFTGADKARKGMIEEAAQGTLFLDEIGDLSLTSQVKLLRLLQEGEYLPLGADRPKRARIRILLATHQNLQQKQSEGTFRKDLYYRLCAHLVEIPSLRERQEDLPLLLEHFLELAAQELGKKKPSYPKELPILLSTYSFPGNIRELRAMIFNAVSLHKSKLLSMDSFRRVIEPSGSQKQQESGSINFDNNPFSSAHSLPSLQQAAEMLVTEAMQRSQGNQTIASRILGISQPALSKRLKQNRS